MPVGGAVVVKFHGGKQLAKVLRALPKRMTNRIHKRIIKLASVPSVKEMKARAPKSTKTLSKSIGTGFQKTGGRGQLIRMGPRVGRNQRNDGWYGFLKEHGTVKKAATPFVLPAFNSKRIVALNIMRREYGREIENEINRVIKRGKI